MFAGSAIAGPGYQDGPRLSARFNAPYALSWARDKVSGVPVLYVADSENHAVRRIDISSGQVSTLFGGPNITQRIANASINQFDRVSEERAWAWTCRPGQQSACMHGVHAWRVDMSAHSSRLNGHAADSSRLTARPGMTDNCMHILRCVSAVVKQAWSELNFQCFKAQQAWSTHTSWIVATNS